MSNIDKDALTTTRKETQNGMAKIVDSEISDNKMR
jgi:hypothetical protein